MNMEHGKKPPRPQDQHATVAMKAWIDVFMVQHHGQVRGICQSASKAMAAAFPDALRVAAGLVYVHDKYGKERLLEHWWCEDAHGGIVDPTASQFGPMGIDEYMEIDLSDTCLPTGRCLYCGDPCFNHSDHCSEGCADANADYLTKDQRRDVVAPWSD